MKLSIYFAKPADTAIAGGDASFITALEYVAKSLPGVRIAAQAQAADLVLIDERYQYRTWHYADELAECSFVRGHAARICVINHDDHARPHLPGLYVSLEKRRPAFVATRPIPYKWDLWKVPVPEAFAFNPSRLYAFRGTFHSHPIRKKMCRALATTGGGVCEELRKAFHSHDETDQLRYIEEIRDASFSLCPRGLSPSSYRLYESMQLGRCPVIISDDWVAPEGPDWNELAVFVRESEVRQLPRLLLDGLDGAEERGRLAAETWNALFCGDRRRAYLLEQAILLHNTKADALGYEALSDLWHGAAFRRRYGWTLARRGKSLVQRKLQAFIQQPFKSH